MGWNEPNKNNPWDKKEPPDLDEVLKRLFSKFKKPRTNGRGKGNGNGGNGRGDNGKGGNRPKSPQHAHMPLLLLLVVVALWFLSGIFIVDPAEQAAILRFGKYVETVGPGPHWIPRIISSKVVLNVDRVSDYSYAAQMLTKDENLVSVALAVQYRIGDLEQYLFNVADPEESLQQATSSALRQVLGKTNLDAIITEGREVWGAKVQDTLIKILDTYKTGIVIVNVSPQPARAPENVQDAFDDAIKAQEDEKRFIEQAKAYEARVKPIAEGNAKRILAEAQAYAGQVVLNAKGETAEFLNLLPQYNLAPLVTGQRLYLDAMQHILSSTSKILVDSKSNNLLYLPLDKMQGFNLQKTPLKPEVSASEIFSNDTGNILYDGRDVTRPTERMNRSR